MLLQLNFKKVYKSYRTRKNLAYCAVVVEQLWWKALDYVVLRKSYVSFFDDQNPDPADVYSWDTARRTRAPQYDPHQRYGHNLRMYYDFWFESQSTEPFFYWLDEGDGKDINLEKCPRNILQQLTGKPNKISTF
ncbi:IQ domain-containing protein IQM1-like [Trifolium pratense]|uniref:IQ domain-containing protein IQM1-like n=1 Tax=Trifolium pratense TaxID=57577 RepID=UPI001E692A81|nr:IQ domain-containing protein IQM1-like [Trifolium pratense]